MNTVAAILIVISSNSYGSITDVTRFDSLAECEAAKEVLMSSFEEYNKGRLFSYEPSYAKCKSLEVK